MKILIVDKSGNEYELSAISEITENFESKRHLHITSIGEFIRDIVPIGEKHQFSDIMKHYKDVAFKYRHITGEMVNISGCTVFVLNNVQDCSGKFVNKPVEDIEYVFVERASKQDSSRDFDRALILSEIKHQLWNDRGSDPKTEEDVLNTLYHEEETILEAIDFGVMSEQIFRYDGKLYWSIDDWDAT